LNFRRVRLEPAEIEKYLLREKDILVNRVNSLPQLGKSILVPTFPEPTVFESNMMRFAVDGIRLLPQYAILFLCSPQAHTQMVGKAKRAVAQSSINQGDVKSLLVPLPPTSEQTTIVRMAAATDRKIEAEEQRKAALQALFQSMLHQLMTGQVRTPDTVEVPQ
jgi:type I restriction enzyme S subunit